MSRILIADPLHSSGLDIFEQAGVEFHLLQPEERPRLAEMIGDFDALVVRSATKVDADLLRAGRRLRVVGRAGIGVDNVDVGTATELGILVVNAPTANLISATEHTFALLLALARNVAAADASLKGKEWDRKRFIGLELDGKALGVVGLGRIGQAVAARAQAFGMKVKAFDPFLDEAVAKRLGIELMELDELLPQVDAVTLHVPMTDQTRNLIDERRIALMKPGVLLVNCARGGVVDEAALLAALEADHVAGAAIDVFANEPLTDFVLAAHPRVVATPHIGAQTHEAQQRVATQTARMLLDALDGSLAVTAVNLPFAAGTGGESFMQLAEQLGRLASSILDGSLKKVQVDLWGVDQTLRVPITVAAVKGALSPFLGEAVNYVNAEGLAAGRGVEVVRATHQGAGEYPHLVGVAVDGDRGSIALVGAVIAERPRVVRFDEYRLEFEPAGRLLVLENRDVPGVVGRIGTLLGQAGANIAEIHLARADGSDAMAVIRLDQQPDAAVVERLLELPEIRHARLVELT